MPTSTSVRSGASTLRPRVPHRPVRHARMAARGAQPARRRQVAQRGGGIAIDYALHVGRAGRACRPDPRGAGRRPDDDGVPASDGQVQPAHEGHLMVDHHHLPDDARPRADGCHRAGRTAADGSASASWRRAATRARAREHHGEIPAQHVDPQPAPAFAQRVQEVAQRGRQAIGRVIAARVHHHPAVDIPAEDEHAVRGLGQCLTECGEVRIGIHQHRKPLARLHPPAVVAGAQDGRVGKGVGH